MIEDPALKTAPGLPGLFLKFAGISAFTIGGGYAMVPVMCDAATKNGWMTEDEFWTLFAKTQAIPGPLALNTALAIGARTRGAAGFAVACAGIILPPFIALILAGSFLDAFGANPLVRDFLEGAAATVPGFVAAMAVRISMRREWTPLRAIATIVPCIALIAFPAWAIPAFFAATFIAWLVEKKWHS